MTQKDFEAIARIIAKARGTWDPAQDIAEAIAARYIEGTVNVESFMLATQVRELTEDDCVV